jgi:transcriptional regulator with XRE-family HTH domain
MNENIKALRQELGWTQHRLAAYLGIDRSSLARMEAGTRALPRPCERPFKQLERRAAINAAARKRREATA